MRFRPPTSCCARRSRATASRCRRAALEAHGRELAAVARVCRAAPVAQRMRRGKIRAFAAAVRPVACGAGGRMIYDYLESPIGQLLLAAEDGGLRYIGFELGRHPVWIGDDWRRDRAAFARGARATRRVFRRRADAVRPAARTAGQRVPAAASGRELRRIPYGATISYGELAQPRRRSARRRARSAPRTAAIRCRSSCRAIA